MSTTSGGFVLPTGATSTYSPAISIDTVQRAAAWLYSNGNNASNGDTITLNGRTYTLVTTLTGADEIKIGATLATTIQNIWETITLLPAGAGVAYGIGTTANADFISMENAYSTWDQYHAKFPDTIPLYAAVNGTAGNGLTSTASSGALYMGSATTTGGQDA